MKTSIGQKGLRTAGVVTIIGDYLQTGPDRSGPDFIAGFAAGVCAAGVFFSLGLALIIMVMM